MTPVLVLLVALVLSQDAVPQDRSADLAAARSLYASAAYEDALARLARVTGADVADQVDTYRALCLLALGRTSDAERSLEQVVLRNPRFTLDETEVSPRLVVMFHAVKARALPTAARTLYTNARTSFDLKQYDAAAAQLRELLLLIGASDASEAAGMADLKVLAEGFLTLAESMLGPNPVAADTPATVVLAPEAGAGPVYSIVHRDVVAPVEISRQVPNWDPPRGFPQGLYQGLVEVVVSEDGRVESAVVRKSVSDAYDAVLLAATATWRFQPATRNGVAVKYRKLFEVIVHSR